MSMVSISATVITYFLTFSNTRRIRTGLLSWKPRSGYAIKKRRAIYTEAERDLAMKALGRDCEVTRFKGLEKSRPTNSDSLSARISDCNKSPSTMFGKLMICSNSSWAKMFRNDASISCKTCSELQSGIFSWKAAPL